MVHSTTADAAAASEIQYASSACKGWRLTPTSADVHPQTALANGMPETLYYRFRRTSEGGGRTFRIGGESQHQCRAHRTSPCGRRILRSGGACVAAERSSARPCAKRAPPLFRGIAGATPFSEPSSHWMWGQDRVLWVLQGQGSARDGA